MIAHWIDDQGGMMHDVDPRKEIGKRVLCFILGLMSAFFIRWLAMSWV